MTEVRAWDYLAEHDAVIRQMRSDGITVPEITAAVGARKQRHLTEYCAQHGIGSTYHSGADRGPPGDSWEVAARAASFDLISRLRVVHPEKCAA